MKPGLFLSEAPEHIYYIQCWFIDVENKTSCNQIFHTAYDYQKHREIEHNERLEYFLDEYDYQYGGKGEIHHAIEWSKKWLKPHESQGRMQVPWPVPIRPARRYFITPEEEINLSKKNTCFCGNSFKWPRRKYCSDECSYKWNYEKFATWDLFRNRFLAKQKTRKENGSYSWNIYYFCDECGKETLKPEVDHIIAIILGGHPWDDRNLQVLCDTCHKIKTKSDVGILAWWRRESNYDTGPEIPNPQTTLDVIFEYNYA